MLQNNDHSEEQALISAFVAQLKKSYDQPYFLKHCRNNTFPAEFWSTLADNGFLGFESPEALGGSAFKTADLVLFLSAIAQAGMASYTLLNQLTSCDLLCTFGSRDQQAKYVGGLIRGERWGFSASARANGRQLFDVGMTAAKEGEDWILNGVHGSVIGGAENARLLVAARTTPGTEGAEGIGLFILDPGASGVSLAMQEMGIRVADAAEFRAITGDVFFTLTCTNVRVSAADMLGEPNRGGAIIEHSAARQMLMLAATGLGWGERVLAQTVEYANNRVIYEEPISSYQAIQHPMVRAKTEIELAKMLVERAVAEYESTEAGAESRLVASGVAKYSALEAAYKACDIAMQAHGGSGYDRDTGIITIWPLMLMGRMVPLNADSILADYADTIFI
jgi:acyl-CoA dehydrogenase